MDVPFRISEKEKKDSRSVTEGVLFRCNLQHVPGIKLRRNTFSDTRWFTYDMFCTNVLHQLYDCYIDATKS